MKKYQMLLATMVATVISVPLGAKLLSGPIRADEAIPLDSKHFPDNAFLKVVKEFDVFVDGYLDKTEIEAIDRIDCSSKGIKSLDGISYFTSLEFLDCSYNELISLDLSKNTELTNLYCGHNAIVSLDFDQNTKLSVLECNDNELIEIDLSQCTEMTMLDFSNNPKFLFFNGERAYLSITSNTLVDLKCDNANLFQLKLFTPNLETLSCMNNGLFSFYNLDNCPKLRTLACDNNRLSFLNLPASLTSLSCSNNDILSISFVNAKVSNLSYLNCSNNRLTMLCNTALYSYSEFYPKLKELNCSKNYLQKVPEVVENCRLTYSPQKTLEQVKNVKADSNSMNSITLTWNKVPDANGYIVYYSTSTTGSYSSIGDIHADTLKIDELKPNTTYYFKIRALFSAYTTTAYGPYSETVPCKTRGTGKVTNAKVVSKTATSVDVSWNKVNGASGYQVWRGTSENGDFKALGSVSETNRICTGLETGTKYYFKVRAYEEVNGKKYYGEYSSVVSAIPVPAAPTNVKSSVVSATKITVSWNKVTGATGYDVYRSTSENGTYSKLGSVTTTSRECPGLVTGTKYYFKVRAYKEVDGKKIYGAYSTVVSAVPVPSAPTNVKAASVSSTKINVSWSKVSGTTGYEVWRAESADGKYSKLGTVTTTNRDCPGLQKGKTYYFKVRAYKEVDGKKTYGAYSTVVSAKTPAK